MITNIQNTNSLSQNKETTHTHTIDLSMFDLKCAPHLSPFSHLTFSKRCLCFQGRMLPHNISQGVIISNHSLVLQGVSRATAGNYSCVGYNAEGDGMSPPFELNVLCKFLMELTFHLNPPNHILHTPIHHHCIHCCRLHG